MLLKNKVEKLKSFIKNDNVLTTLEERYCYATDASNNISELTIPDIVIFPETIDEVQKIVKYANTHEIPIISRGAGTNMVGACTCNVSGIILNFSKMNNIISISTDDMMIKVQPGVTLGKIKNEVEKFGLFFPPDPSNYKVSTIGGAIAQSSGGALAFKYGTIKDYILSLKVVTADGRLMTLGFDTMKESAGYHLNQLIVGSEGTLAIVVEATLKLLPKPECRGLITAYFDNIQKSIMAVNKILTNNIFPSAIEFMDNNSINTVEEFLKCGLKTDSECLILIELDGHQSAVSKEKKCVIDLLNNSGATLINEYDECSAIKIWDARHSSFAASSRLSPDVITDDIIVPRKNLYKIIEACQQICDKYGLKVCIVGHIGDANIHPQIVLNLENENEYRNYISAKSDIYELTSRLGGVISAEHGIGVEKQNYFEKLVDPNALEYMKLIKRLFDPKNILNPGKIFKL